MNQVVFFDPFFQCYNKSLSYSFAIALCYNTLKDFRKEERNIICTFHYHKQSIVKPDFYCEEKGDKWIVYPWETKDSEEIQDYLKEENINE